VRGRDEDDKAARKLDVGELRGVEAPGEDNEGKGEVVDICFRPLYRFWEEREREGGRGVSPRAT
jgi:hypothetical protein